MKSQGIYLSWIVVKDIEKAIKFYTEVAGLELKQFDREYHWAELSGPNGAILGIAGESDECPIKAGSNAIVTISVDDIDKANAYYIEKGATLVGEVIEVPGHVKMQTFVDIDGNTLQTVQKLD
ncbi:MAG: VOC family protein [Parachlamydiaceae bacterium]|nr:VOC family protein [Parachlamydiaceae bacterium]